MGNHAERLDEPRRLPLCCMTISHLSSSLAFYCVPRGHERDVRRILILVLPSGRRVRATLTTFSHLCRVSVLIRLWNTTVLPWQRQRDLPRHATWNREYVDPPISSNGGWVVLDSATQTLRVVWELPRPPTNTQIKQATAPTRQT